MDPRTTLLGAYARAVGLRAALPSNDNAPGSFGHDLNAIISVISDQIGDFSGQILMGPELFWGGRGTKGNDYCYASVVRLRVSQLISYLEHIHHINSNIGEIGSLFNSIKDPDLKSRCSDLLSAPGNFDRAINQATQVLEDKIRKKSQIDSSLTGPNLVSAAINTNPDRGLIRVSTNDQEHEGIGHICRGLMLAFRNPTHHSLSDKYTREDALKLCAFIDNLISTIDQSVLITK